jgi:hypothetical protein
MSSTSSECSLLSVSVIFSGEHSPGAVFSCFWPRSAAIVVGHQLLHWNIYQHIASSKKVETWYDATSYLQERDIYGCVCSLRVVADTT